MKRVHVILKSNSRSLAFGFADSCVGENFHSSTSRFVVPKTKCAIAWTNGVGVPNGNLRLALAFPCLCGREAFTEQSLHR